MSLYDSFSNWVNKLVSWMGSCLGYSPYALIEDPQKMYQTSFSEDFWGSSIGEIDIPISLLQRSFTSLSQANLSFHSDVGSNSHSGFVNNGLLLWTKLRLQWIGAIKSSNQSQQSLGPPISANAKGVARRPVPLGEMVDFLVDSWENEGLYD